MTKTTLDQPLRPIEQPPEACAEELCSSSAFDPILVKDVVEASRMFEASSQACRTLELILAGETDRALTITLPQLNWSLSVNTDDKPLLRALLLIAIDEQSLSFSKLCALMARTEQQLE